MQNNWQILNPAFLAFQMFAVKVVHLLGALCLLIMVMLILDLLDSTSTSQTLLTSTDQMSPNQIKPVLKPNILDGCYHVYLDMGTNM